jgi:hypothetical protein
MSAVCVGREREATGGWARRVVNEWKLFPAFGRRMRALTLP